MFYKIKFMKIKTVLIVIILSIISGSCKREIIVKSSEDEAIHMLDSIVQNETISTINPYLNCYENSLRKIQFVEPVEINDTLITLFNGKIALSDLSKNLVLSKYEINVGDNQCSIDFEIYGYSPEIYRIENILLPYSFLDGLNSYAKISSNEVIIPYFNDLEWESTILTRWLIDSDSLKFNGYFRNVFESKYSNILPKLVITTSKFQYILGLTTFGEGGGYGEGYWLGKVIDNNFLEIQEIYMTGYDSSDDTLKQLTYIKKSNFLIFYENYYTNTNESFNEKDYLSKKKVAKVELK